MKFVVSQASALAIVALSFAAFSHSAAAVTQAPKATANLTVAGTFCTFNYSGPESGLGSAFVAFFGKPSCSGSCGSISANVNTTNNTITWQWQSCGSATRTYTEILSCDPGFQLQGAECVRINQNDPLVNQGPPPAPDICCGNPINPGFANKYQREVDYAGSGVLPLAFERHYNSRAALPAGSLGPNWRHSYSRKITTRSHLSLTTAFVERADGKAYAFTLINGVWTAEPNVMATLTSSGGGWIYREGDVSETYGSNGRLTQVAHRNGWAQALAYDGSGRLASVTDSFGRMLTFGYTDDLVASVTVPGGGIYLYDYDAADNLAMVTGPDALFRTYQYTEPGQPHALSGITDELNEVFATFDYDVQGRAISTEHAGGAEEVTVAYNADGTATATDALNQSRTYGFQTLFGAARTANSTQNGITADRTYDANGFLASREDLNGNVTTYTHNARGLETSRIEAYGTALARTISTQWHPSFRLPTQIDEPGRRTVYTYDSANGDRLTQTVTDLATSESRTTTWTYTTFGRVLTVDGPRTDVTDVSAYTYYDCTTGAECGQVHTITNAEGHVTEVTDYDAHGNPLSIEDPNGVVTTLTYDARQRLKTRSVAGATTTFDYDGVGQLDKVTLPGGAFLGYTYDAAHRLTDIEDNAGNRIHYTLDLMGNRTAEEVFDPSDDLQRRQSQVFDTLGRLQQIKNANGAVTVDFDYDDEGNRTGRTDAGAFSSSSTYDALNRLEEVTDAAGATGYAYNSLDQLVSVTDPEGLVTSYATNAFGEVKEQTSPDTGETSYSYDAAGNRTAQTDARGVTVQYGYDALNRLTSINYVGSSTENVSYFYDSEEHPYGKGRLTGIEDESGTTTLIYDARGNITQEQRVIGQTTHTTSYEHDTADRLTTVTYPTGRVVTYVRNVLGQMSEVTSKVGSADPVIVARNIQYKPFGGVRSYELGNGVVVTRDYDQDYRVSGIEDQGTSLISHRTLTYDLRGNIESILDHVTNDTQTFGLDALSRLTSADGDYGLQEFTYDGVGNRLTQDVTIAGDTESDVYSYPFPRTSHQLSTTSIRSFDYDNAGNVTESGPLEFTYNAAGRPALITGGSSAVSAVYNASAQRVKKTAGGVTTVFHYDRSGRLLAETFDSGLLLRREYIWLEDIPLALESEREVPEYTVDNVDGGFTATGAWNTASATGQYGSNFAYRGPATEVPGERVLDNADSGTWSQSIWVPQPCGLCTDGYGLTYHASVLDSDPVNGSPATFYWPVALPGPGPYRVYVRWPVVSGAGPATYQVQALDETVDHQVDQGLPSNGWHSLGTYEFGTEAVIALKPAPGFKGVADAVKVVPVEDIGSDLAHWAPTAESGTYEVFARWPAAGGATTAAPFEVTDSGGSTPQVLDQTTAAGQWNSLGIFTFDGPTQGVTLGAVWDESVLADAMRFVPVEESSHRKHLAYFHVDHLNTPQKMTDSNQAVVWEAAYEPFGEATVTAQAHFDNPLRFPGQYFDAETGLHQNWHRDYDPSLGRYLQSDPIGLGGGLNTYAYVGSNPLTRIDPEGLLQSEFTEPDALKRPPSPPPGADACAYYDEQCGASCGKDKYACNARKCCESFKDNYSNRCTRGCLIEWDKRQCNSKSGKERDDCRRRAHVVCYAKCGNITELVKSDFGRNPPAECRAAADAMGGM